MILALSPVDIVKPELGAYFNVVRLLPGALCLPQKHANNDKGEENNSDVGCGFKRFGKF